MARSLQEIQQEVQSLQVADRNLLIRDLIADMGGEPEDNVEQAWLEESKRRYLELQAGQVESIPSSDVIRNARLRLKNAG